MDKTIKSECLICGLPTQLLDVTILTCGHVTHARCTATLGRNYAYCPKCETSELLESDTSRKTPIHWGDDKRIDDLVEKKAILLQYLEESDKTARLLEVQLAYNTTSETDEDDELTEEKSAKRTQISLKALNRYLSMKEIKDRELSHKYNSDTHPGLGHERPNTMLGSLKDMIYKAMDTYGSSYDIRDAQPAKLISSRVSSASLVDQYNIDAKTLIKHRISLEQIIENGYNIDDLIILRTTWTDMKSLGLPSSLWHQWKKNALPIQKMVDIWNITYFDVYIDFCNSSITALADMDLTLDELKALQ